MPLRNPLFGRRPASAEAPLAPGQWHCLLIPALDQPFSSRALEVAYRLAQGTTATVQLAFFIEVPRALALDAALPDTEAVAGSALRAAQEEAVPFGVSVQPVIHRTRSAHDRILSLIAEEKVDLLVLGARPDRQRGLPGDMARDLFLAAPCEVIVDYIANEK